VTRAGTAAVRRGKLGAALRDARRAAGLTQERAAEELGCRQGKINKIETTQCAVSPKDLNRLLEIYQASDELANRIKVLAAPGAPGQPTGSHPNSAFLQLLELEPQASEILALHSERIPGLLQSEYYTLSQFSRAGDPTDLAALLYDRQQRARLFTTENPPRYRVVLSESSLYRMPGGRTPALVIDQAEHLLTLDETHEQVSVHILTFEADIPYLDADFTVLKFTDGTKDLAYVEYATEGKIFRAAKPVAERELYWQRVRNAALGTEDSRKFLEDLIDRARAGWRSPKQ
jgi:transcriptional regulator with XRE-family HTH domain